jgi:hypothetical protein
MTGTDLFPPLVDLNPVLEDYQLQDLTSFYRYVKPLIVDIFLHFH